MTSPSSFDRDIADRLIQWISQGKPLSRFCSLDGMPSMVEVMRWRKRHPEFAEEYREALEASHETMAEDALCIADEEPTRTATETIDTGHVAWAKLRIETRMRYLGKVSRRFGEKLQIGGDGGEPIVLSDAERSAKIDALMRQALDRYQSQQEPHLHDHARGDWDNEDGRTT